MSLFDAIINETNQKFGLGTKAGSLLSALLALMTDKNRGGFAGFLDSFNGAGLGNIVQSWIGRGASEPVSDTQLRSALGESTLREISSQAGVDEPTAASALAFMTPKVVNALTPGGTVPNETDLLSTIGNYISGLGGAVLGGIGAAGAAASGAFDKAGATADSAFDRGKAAVGSGVDAIGDSARNVGEKTSAAFNRVDNAIDGDPKSSVLTWLIPLILLLLAIILGYMFCGKSNVPTTTVNTNTNANRNTNVTGNTSAKVVDSSFRLEAKDGKYTVTGVVKDEATKKQIMDALNAQYGAGNVNYDGLKVDANAKDFGPGWWANFQKLLPDLKDWKTGVLAFTGSAITEAAGVPAAIMDKIKSLFTGWTLPTVSASTTEAPRTLTEVALPDGKKLQAYPGGIEDQLIKFIESDEYKNATADSLKNKWFNFDDLNFKFGTTELVPESKRQLDNIVAILKAFPSVKIKIAGYTDKKGDEAANKKLSDDRAKAVQAALGKSGVGAQVPEAEGYGEEFATVPETASDKEREADRKTSVRLLK